MLANRILAQELPKRGLFGRADWEDVRQEVMLTIWQAEKRHPGQTQSYYYCCGRYAVCRWFRKRDFAYLEIALRGYYQKHRPQQRRGLSRAQKRELAARLKSTYHHQTRAKRRIIARQVRYLDLRMKGYSALGVEMEMRLPYRGAVWMRQYLLPRLALLAKGNGKSGD